MTIPLSEYRPFEYEILAAPLVVTEAQGEVEVITLTATLPAGVYMVSVSMVAQFTTANDQLTWRIGGNLASPNFLIEAKDNAENIPFAYGFPTPWAGGAVTMTMYASIDGIGAADVTITAANITFERKGE